MRLGVALRVQQRAFEHQPDAFLVVTVHVETCIISSAFVGSYGAELLTGHDCAIDPGLLLTRGLKVTVDLLRLVAEHVETLP